MKKLLILTGCLLFPCSLLKAEPSEQNIVTNPDGSFTFTQKVDKNSSTPHYVAPDGYGFSYYSWFDEDYGWQHNFSEWNNEDIQIISATMMIRGFDVDSEPRHGTGGEYDGISVDGVDLNPGLLQGTNGTWSETTFNVPLSSIKDDGLINVFLDIDMNHERRKWATTLDYSLLTITYIETPSKPPFTPVLEATPATCINPSLDLSIAVTNTDNADPDGDPVTYRYRWFVDVGQGEVVDDEFAGKQDHTGNSVNADQVLNGETWRVAVTAVDSNGLISEEAIHTWEVSNDCDGDGINDDEDDYPEDADRASNNYSIQSTLAFEDRWPEKGDYDLNDFVFLHRFNLIKDANNQVKQIDLEGSITARGASRSNAFAIEFGGTTGANVESAVVTINSEQSSMTAEAGHSSSLVFTIVPDIHTVTNTNPSFTFFNTQDGDDRDAVPVTFSIIFTEPVNPIALGNAPFNPFIYPMNDRGREIHLPNYSPTALANSSLFKTADDNSEVGSETYMTKEGHPWVLEITSNWLHPLEQIDIVEAYPEIQSWAESRKSRGKKWHKKPRAGKCWKCK